MKKILSLALIGATSVALSACAAHNGTDYGYEQEAPFASERTVGTVPHHHADAVPAPARTAGDRVFSHSQRK